MSKDEYIPLSELIDAGAFGGRSVSARQRAARRWVAKLSSAYKRKINGEWQVSAAARLPDNVPVRTVRRLGCEPTLNGFRLPLAADTWTAADRQRFLDTHELLRKYDRFKTEFLKLPEAELVRLFAAQYDQWAADRKLKLSVRSIQRYRERVTPGHPRFDGNVDRRGRTAAQKAVESCSNDAWDAFLGLILRESKLSQAEAWKVIAIEAKGKGWNWPSLRTVQLRAKREIPKPARILAQEGPRKFAAACLPKITRDYNEIPAGHHWVADERTLDIMAKVPDERRGWRIIRPKLTAWMDMRSRVFVGWTIQARANTDTILAAFKMGAAAFGLPGEVTCDNGTDYKSAAAKSKKWDAFDKARVGSVYDQTGIAVHWAIPYQPWSKSIESAFRTVKNGFDKYFHTYCGGKPDERPHNLNQKLSNPDKVPTVEELSRDFREYIQSYHASPHSGDGMNELTPNLVMEQYRGQIRRCSQEVLDLLCARQVGPVTVGRDGIKLNGITYGQFSEALFPLQGQKVMLRIDPDRADVVTVCGLDGRPICKARNEQLSGSTQEDIRKAAQKRSRLKKTAREYLRGREFSLDSKPGQVMSLKRQAAEAAEAEQARQLPAAHRPNISVVRPDLHDDARKLADPFARLASKNEALPKEAAAVDWALLNRQDDDARDGVADVDPYSLLANTAAG